MYLISCYALKRLDIQTSYTPTQLSNWVLDIKCQFNQEKKKQAALGIDNELQLASRWLNKYL